MDFRLSSEQEMLRESVRRFIDERYGFETRQARIRRAVPPGRDLWRQMAELGWMAAPLPDPFGGLGGGPIDSAIILEEFGRGLMLEPWLATAVFATRTILASQSVLHQQRLLPAIADGSLQVAVAYLEGDGSCPAGPLRTTATRIAGGYRLEGEKAVVLGGATADFHIVTASLDGGNALFVVGARDTGVSARPYRLIDDSEVADLRFHDCAVPTESMLCGPDRGRYALEVGLDHAAVGICAELIGSMECGLEMTAAYLKQRRQFGRALSDFQVMQHRMADSFIELDTARSLVMQALSGLELEATSRQRAVSACKYRVSEAARSVLGDAVHNHGGMGMTIEYPIGHYFRRALVAERLFGSGAQHMQRYLSLEGQSEDGGLGFWAGPSRALCRPV